MVTYSVKTVPAGAWDTHHHIFEPDKFPFAAGRHFTPAVASLQNLKDFEASIGVDNVVIAHGLSYGPDCTSLLSYLKDLSGKSRGICVLDIDSVTDELLDAYHEAGVRSVRLDFFKAKAMNSVELQIALIEATAARLMKWNKHKWSIQIQQPNLDYWLELVPLAARLPVPLVVDHIALIQAPSMAENPTDYVDPTQTEGWRAMLGALSHGNLWIKISAPYRCSNIFHTYDDLEPAVRAIVKANKRRTLWGSDWPHTQRHKDRIGKSADDREAFLIIDDAAWIRSLSRWLDEEEWYQMWVENPRELYG